MECPERISRPTHPVADVLETPGLFTGLGKSPPKVNTCPTVWIWSRPYYGGIVIIKLLPGHMIVQVGQVAPGRKHPIQMGGLMNKGRAIRILSATCDMIPNITSEIGACFLGNDGTGKHGRISGNTAWLKKRRDHVGGIGSRNLGKGVRIGSRIPRYVNGWVARIIHGKFSQRGK